MTLIMGNGKAFLTEAEKEVLRLRKVLASARDNQSMRYKEGDKDHNASVLRAVWKEIRRAEVIHDYLQRAYFAVTLVKPSIVSVVENRAGDRHVLYSTLNHYKAFQYSDDARTLISAEDSLNRRRNVTEEMAERELMRLKEKCEQIAQEKHRYIRVEIHNVSLMKKYHDSREGVTSTKRTLCVNVDNQFTWLSEGRFQMLRRHFTLPPSQINPDDVRNRINQYCDSVRNIGERLTLQGSYRTRAPEANLLLCCMAELCKYMEELHVYMDALNRGILSEVKKFPGFVGAGKADNIAEARTIRYATGVVVYSGLRPVKTYSIEAMKTQQLQKFCAMGALNVDVPRFSWVTLPDKEPNPSSGTSMGWSKAQRFVKKRLDPKILKARRALKRM